MLLAHQGAVPRERRPRVAQDEGRHLVPADVDLVLGVHEPVEQGGSIPCDARLQNQIWIASDDVDRVVLNAAEMLEQLKDSGFPGKSPRREKPLVRQEKSSCVHRLEDH